MVPSRETAAEFLLRFQAGLREFGYEENRDYVLEARYAGGVLSDLPRLAADLVQLTPDLMTAASAPAAPALKSSTSDIPIVAVSLGDPIDLGLVQTYARPNSNLTGILSSPEGLAGKQLALALEFLPGAKSAGLLINATNQTQASQRRGIEEAAVALGVSLAFAEIRSPDGLNKALTSLARAGSGIVFVLSDAMFVDQRRRIAATTLSHFGCRPCIICVSLLRRAGS